MKRLSRKSKVIPICVMQLWLHHSKWSNSQYSKSILRHLCYSRL